MATKTAPPKAKNSEIKKLMVTAIKKTVKNNSSLPVLEDVYFDGQSAVVTDLETSVVVPFPTDLNICVPAKKVIDILDIMEYPKLVKTPPTVIPKPTYEVNGKHYYVPDPAGGGISKEYIKRSEEDIDITLEQYVEKYMPEATQPFDTLVIENQAVDAIEGKRKIKISGESALNFPVIPMYSDNKNKKPIGRLDAAGMELLKEALMFVSDDDLRPAMTGVYFEEKKGKTSMIVATDAHRLFFDKIQPIEQSFILPQKTAKILLAFGGEWDLEADNDNHVSFTREDGLKVVARIIDARFPDFRVVIPTGEPNVKLFACPTLLSKELKNAAKFANRSTKMVTIHLNGVCTLSSQDVDFGEEYVAELDQNKAEIGFNPKWDPGFLYEGNPVIIKEDRGAVAVIRDPGSFSDKTVEKSALTKAPKEFLIAFNSSFLQDILGNIKNEPAEIHLWAPNKAAVINGKYLIMPLMLNS